MPVIESSLVYVFQDDEVLMLHRVKKKNDIHEGKWNGLGGKSERGESPAECAIREVKEESNLDVHKVHFAGHITFPYFDGTNDWSVFIFTADDFSGDIEDCDEGNLHWVKVKDMMSKNLWPGDRQFLPLVLDKKLFSGKISYENGELVKCDLQTVD